MRLAIGAAALLLLAGCASVPKSDAVTAFSTALTDGANAFDSAVTATQLTRADRLHYAEVEHYAHGGLPCLSQNPDRGDCAWLLSTDDTRQLFTVDPHDPHHYLPNPDLGNWKEVRQPVLGILRDYAAGLQLLASDPAEERVRPALTALSDDLKTTSDSFAALMNTGAASAAPHASDWNADAAKAAVSGLTAAFDLWFSARREHILRDIVPRMQPHIEIVSHLLSHDVSVLADQCNADVAAMHTTAQTMLEDHGVLGSPVVHGRRGDTDSLENHVDAYQATLDRMAAAQSRCAALARASSTFAALPAAHHALVNPDHALSEPALARFIADVQALDALFH